MHIGSRTYPQPDSPQANIGPRERALAVLKYVLDLEPGVTNPRDARLYDPVAAEQFARLRALYERTDLAPRDGATAALVVLGLGDGTVEATIAACLEHSFEQEARRRRGEPLAPALLALRRS